MAKELPKFTAGPEPKLKFHDLGETPSYPEPAMASPRPKKYYPTVHIRHKVPGLHQVGMTKTVRVKMRVKSAEERDGDDPTYGLELRGIHHGD